MASERMKGLKLQEKVLLKDYANGKASAYELERFNDSMKILARRCRISGSTKSREGFKASSELKQTLDAKRLEEQSKFNDRRAG